MAHEGDRIGPYTLIKKLGSGAFGEVWFAKRRTRIITTDVALKIPRGDAVDWNMFKREAEVWVQATGHPNILSIIEADVFAWSGDEEVTLDKNTTAKEQIIIASEINCVSGIHRWRRPRPDAVLNPASHTKRHKTSASERQSTARNFGQRNA